MPTKMELEKTVADLADVNKELRVEIQDAQLANLLLIAELEEMQIVAQEKLPADCINCGQTRERIKTRVEGDSIVYHCPVCDHDWTREHEAAPFRAIRKGI